MTDTGSDGSLTLGGELTLKNEQPPWHQRFAVRICVLILFILLALGAWVDRFTLADDRDDLQEHIERAALVSRDESACRANLVAQLQIANSDLAAAETDMVALIVRNALDDNAVTEADFTAALANVEDLKAKRGFARSQAANADVCRLFG